MGLPAVAAVVAVGLPVVAVLDKVVEAALPVESLEEDTAVVEELEVLELPVAVLGRLLFSYQIC